MSVALGKAQFVIRLIFLAMTKISGDIFHSAPNLDSPFEMVKIGIWAKFDVLKFSF